MFHRRTNSSNFFFEILERVGSLSQIYFDPIDCNADVERLSQVDWSQFDLVVVWQLDILALFPLSAGVPTVLAPMYDGSGGLPPAHWVILQQASLLSFSYHVHLKTRDVLKHTLYTQYFPNPGVMDQVYDFDTLRVFFWERAPEQVSVSTAYKLIGHQASAWRLHLARDDGGPSEVIPPPSGTLQTSSWHADRRLFESALDSCNVFICPRTAEGIGMAMLEAMARGMCVLASVEPVHDEYLADDVTGLLFDPSAPRQVDLTPAQRLGAAARRRVEQGYAQWRADQPAIEAFLRAAARRRPELGVLRLEPRALACAYFNEFPSYLQRLAELQNLYVAEFAAQVVSPSGLAPHEGGATLQAYQRLMNRFPGWGAIRRHVPTGVRRVGARLVNFAYSLSRNARSAAGRRN